MTGLFMLGGFVVVSIVALTVLKMRTRGAAGRRWAGLK